MTAKYGTPEDIAKRRAIYTRGRDKAKEAHAKAVKHGRAEAVQYLAEYIAFCEARLKELDK